MAVTYDKTFANRELLEMLGIFPSSVLYRNDLQSHEAISRQPVDPDYESRTHRSRTGPFNTNTPKQNDRHFAGDISTFILLYDKFCTLIPISPKYIATCPVDHKPSLVHIMIWLWFELLLAYFNVAYMCHTPSVSGREITCSKQDNHAHTKQHGAMFSDIELCRCGEANPSTSKKLRVYRHRNTRPI